MTYDFCVVGAGPAGHAAATAYREAGGTGTVLLLAGEGRPPYRRPPLSKELLRGELEPDALPLTPDPDTYTSLGITLHHATARALHPAAAVATPGDTPADSGALNPAAAVATPGDAPADSGARRPASGDAPAESGEPHVVLDDGSSVAYGTCVLATGAQPVRPDVPGVHLPGVQMLRTVADALSLRSAAAPGTRVLVLGSGFIGCEAAASLRARGCQVTLLSQELAPQEARLGTAVAERIAGWLESEGVDARYERTLQRIERDADGTLHATASDGATTAADVVLLAGGVAPDTALARAAGLAVDDATGLVRADAQQRTSAPGVLACGDCALTHHAIADRPLHVEHWGDALAQGAVAGWTAAGRAARWDVVPGFWSTIGRRTLKHAAWGDGFDTINLVEHGNDGAFTAWYGDAAGRCAGVLTHDFDPDYEAGRRMIEQGAARP
jgi:3-phenylpropionate/trans-cinnamate dioxygenase ferredoxin reductase component